MSFFVNANVNSDISKDLSYSSWINDEKARKQRSHTISKTARFRGIPKNGNLQSIVPEIDDEDVRKTLAPFMLVSTSTRTVFHNDMYDTHASIADRVSSFDFKSEAFKLTGHNAMTMYSSTDPRCQHVRPPGTPDVGPGCYKTDPLCDKTTGIPGFEANESHHMTPFTKDPTRPSPAFKSPERGGTAFDKVVRRVTDAIPFPRPDYDSWTSKSFFMPRQPRNIDCERWGPNSRERKPPPVLRPQSVYDPTVTTDGHAATCEAYTSDPLSPSCKAAFDSGMPRLVALPGGSHPDTRLICRSYEHISGATANVGPGTYSLEPPRFRSFNAAYNDKDVYHSLASSSADPVRTQPLGSSGHSPNRTRPHTTSASATSSSLPNDMRGTSPTRRSLVVTAPGYTMAPNTAASSRHSLSSPNQRLPAMQAVDQPSTSAPVSPTTPAVDTTQASYEVDWEVHQALASAAHGNAVLWPDSDSKPTATDTEASPSRHVSISLPCSPTSAAEQGQHTQQQPENAPLYCFSAPQSPLQRLTRKRAACFGQLMFLRRATAHRSVIRSHLDASADLRHAREMLKKHRSIRSKT